MSIVFSSTLGINIIISLMRLLPTLIELLIKQRIFIGSSILITCLRNNITTSIFVVDLVIILRGNTLPHNVTFCLMLGDLFYG